MKLKLFTNWEHFKFLSLFKWVSITESTVIYSNELWKTEEDLRDPDNWNMERNGHGSQGRLQRRSLNKNKQLLRRKLNRESRYRKGISGNSVRAIKERPPKEYKVHFKNIHMIGLHCQRWHEIPQSHGFQNTERERRKRKGEGVTGAKGGRSQTTRQGTL